MQSKMLLYYLGFRFKNVFNIVKKVFEIGLFVKLYRESKLPTVLDSVRKAVRPGQPWTRVEAALRRL